MQGKHWLIIVAMLALGACDWKVRNEYRCPDGEFCPPVGGPCSGDNECRAPTPVCNEDANVCVECMENRDCAASRPICSTQNECVQCQSDDDCDSKLCLLDGACAAPGEVTYVGGPNAMDNPACTIDKPCQNLEQGLRGMALRRYIKLTGTIVETDKRTISKTVSIYGRSSAQISSSKAGEVLLLKGMGAPIIQLIDLEIIGNMGATGKDCVMLSENAQVTMTRVHVRNHNEAGISLEGTAKLVLEESQIHDNAKDGVKATGGTLEIRRSFIYLNKGTAGVFALGAGMVTIDSSVITRNTGTNGGVSISGPLSILNSIISGNGDSGTVVGGLTLNSNNATFEFNTVADNASSGTPDLGMSCLNPIDVSNSILTGNLVNGCNVTFSLVDSATPGNGNMVGMPMFLSADAANPASPMFYRISRMSAARDLANTAATLDVDIDGQKRGTLEDARRDMGADEFVGP